MEATLKISDSVFRHLIVRKPLIKSGVTSEAAIPPPPEPAAQPAETAEPASATAADATAPADTGAEEDKE